MRRSRLGFVGLTSLAVFVLTAAVLPAQDPEFRLRVAPSKTAEVLHVDYLHPNPVAAVGVAVDNLDGVLADNASVKLLSRDNRVLAEAPIKAGDKFVKLVRVKDPVEKKDAPDKKDASDKLELSGPPFQLKLRFEAGTKKT